MGKKQYIAICLIAVIGLAVVIFVQRNTEPSYQGYSLSWWVRHYGFSYPDQRDAKDAEAIITIGTNALPYLMDWIRNPDAQPSHARHSTSLFIQRLPKILIPSSLASWADENTFHSQVAERAMCAAAAFSVLGTNAASCIPELKTLVANPRNGFVCTVAESALVRMGPDGFTAVLEIIATPGLPQRRFLMEGDVLAKHMQAPNEHTIVGQADPNYRINSIRAAPILLKCLGDNDPFIQQRAFALLSYSDPDSMVPALTHFLLTSPPPAIRRKATEAIAKHGQDAQAAIPFLSSRCSDPDPDIRAEASNALVQITAQNGK